MGPNDPVQGRLVKRPLFLSLIDKRARTYLSCSRWSSIFFGWVDRVSTRAVRVPSRARFKIRFDAFRGLRRCRVFVVISMIDNVVLRIKKVCRFVYRSLHT